MNNFLDIYQHVRQRSKYRLIFQIFRIALGSKFYHHPRIINEKNCTEGSPTKSLGVVQPGLRDSKPLAYEAFKYNFSYVFIVYYLETNASQ